MPVRGRTISQCTLTALSPRADRAVRFHCEALPASGGHGECPAQPANLNRRMPCRGRAVAHFAMEIESPGPNAAIEFHCNAPRFSGCRGDHTTQPADLHRIGSGRCGAVTQLTIKIVSPRPKRAVGFYGKSAPRRQGDDVIQSQDLRRQSRRAICQKASPSPDGPVRLQCTVCA